MQGTAGRNPLLDRIAQGCVKVTGLTARTEARVRALLAAGDVATAFRTALAEVAAITDTLPGVSGLLNGSPRGCELADVAYCDLRGHLPWTR